MPGTTDDRRPTPARGTAAGSHRWVPPPLTPEPADVPEPGEALAQQRFQAALVGGNPREVRRAAAALSRLSLADAAAILLVIEGTEPENYERAALQWLARLAAEAPHGDLPTIARAAVALAVLPSQPLARAELAGVCLHLSVPEAAEVFARDHYRFVRERERTHSQDPLPPAAPGDARPDQPWELVATP